MTFRSEFPGLSEGHYKAVESVFGNDDWMFMRDLQFYAMFDKEFKHPWLENDHTVAIDEHRERLRKLAFHALATCQTMRHPADAILLSGSEERLGAIMTELAALSAAAGRLAKSTQLLRAARGEHIDRRRQRPRGPARDLWPALARSYAATGRTPSASDRALFVKVVRAAHDALDLDPPALTSLGRVVREHRKASALP